MIDTSVLKRNPFPGVRPFTSAEDKYFFGRETTTSEVLDLLQDNRFVALVGPSASGKTSLIQSGVIPALITKEKQEWVPVAIHPGTKPVESLVRGFQQVFPKKLKESDVQTFLSGNQEIGDLIIEKGLGSHNYFLVVDPFEDLFRTSPSERPSSRDPEIRRFVDLLVKAVKAERPEIYVLLSIRSDFIEASSASRSLTELMNRSKYLLSQMSREALAASISGPIQRAGARIEPGFVEYLLDDLEDLEIPLPRLQHALMRTWDYWSRQGDVDQPITISDYQAVGSVNNALGNSLEEAFDELDENKQHICERLFKSITSKSEQFNGFRRQARLGNISRIAQCSMDDLADVVDVFQRPGRAFLTTYPSSSLNGDTLVELSHESLIRIWERLGNWVDEENDSCKMYLKLSEASALYQQGRTELWKHPELQLALNWRESQKPTPAWGVQYHPAFERAMVFLKTSEEEQSWEEERKIILQKRRLFLNRAIAVFMGALVIVLATVFLITRNSTSRQTESEQQAVVSDPYTVQTDGSTSDSRVRTDESARVLQEETGTQQSEPSQMDAREETVPDTRFETVPDERAETVPDAGVTGNELQHSVPDPSQRRTSSSRTSSSRTGGTTTAQQETGAAESRAAREAEAREAERAFAAAAVATAQQAARNSIGLSQDPDLKGLLAYQAYRINAQYKGAYYDNDIYLGMYEALKKLISPAYNIYPNLRNSVKDIQWLDRTGSLITVSSDGSIKILSSTFANRASQITLRNTGEANECLIVSPDERTAAVGTNGGGLLFLELENQGSVVDQNSVEGKIVLFLSNLGRTGEFVSAGTDNRILKWNYTDRTPSLLVSTDARPSALAASRDGKRVAYGTRDGKLFELDIDAPQDRHLIREFDRNHVKAIAYSPGEQNIVVGLQDGSVQVLAGSGRQRIALLRGPEAGITDLAYSPDGRFIAGTSNDGKVYLWNTVDWSNPPLIFDENNGFVLSVCFSGDSRQFFSGSVDYPRFIGRPSSAEVMADEFCPLLGRNLTQAEWDQYFGGEIPYMETCPRGN